MTKHHRPSGLNNTNIFLQSSGNWKSDTKLLAGLVSSKD